MDVDVEPVSVDGTERKREWVSMMRSDSKDTHILSPSHDIGGTMLIGLAVSVIGVDVDIVCETAAIRGGG